MNKTILGVMVLLIGGSVAVAQMGPGGPGGRDDGPGCQRGPGMKGFQIGRLLHDEDAAKQAGVTDEQIAALRAAMYKNKEALIDLRAKKEKIELQIQQLMDSSTAEKAAFDKLIDEQGLVETAMRKTAMNMKWDAREILGAEKYDALTKKSFNQAQNKEKGRGKGYWRQKEGQHAGKPACMVSGQQPPAQAEMPSGEPEGNEDKD
ncbi:MAG: hypothetical protein V2A34_15610 [Lentisphaerota bacterium]